MSSARATSSVPSASPYPHPLRGPHPSIWDPQLSGPGRQADRPLEVPVTPAIYGGKHPRPCQGQGRLSKVTGYLQVKTLWVLSISRNGHFNVPAMLSIGTLGHTCVLQLEVPKAGSLGVTLSPPTGTLGTPRPLYWSAFCHYKELPGLGRWISK